MAEKGAPPQWVGNISAQQPPAYQPQNGWGQPPQTAPGQAPGHVYPSLPAQQPPQQWPAPPAQQPAKVVYKPVSSSMLGNLMDDVKKSTKSITKDVSKKYDELATSQILKLFASGSTIQLISKITGLALTCYPNSGMDCKGQPGSQDPRTHFTVVNYGSNIVSLQNRGFPNVPNTFLVIAPNGYLYCTGIGDTSCRFRLHETHDHFISLESYTAPEQHIAINPDGSVRPGLYSKDKTAEANFAVHVISPAPSANATATAPPNHR